MENLLRSGWNPTPGAATNALNRLQSIMNSYAVALRWVSHGWKSPQPCGDGSLHYSGSRLYYKDTLIARHFGDYAFVRSEKLPRKSEKSRRMVLLACSINSMAGTFEFFKVKDPDESPGPDQIADYRIRIGILVERAKRTKHPEPVISDIKKLVAEAQRYAARFNVPAASFHIDTFLNETEVRTAALQRMQKDLDIREKAWRADLSKIGERVHTGKL